MWSLGGSFEFWMFGSFVARSQLDVRAREGAYVWALFVLGKWVDLWPLHGRLIFYTGVHSPDPDLFVVCARTHGCTVFQERLIQQGAYR